MDTQAKMMRIASYRIHQSLVEKPLPVEEYWPLRSDKKEILEPISIDKEMFDKIKKIHKLKE